ncbi:holin [Pseudoxanthomonas winnipegensis]|uniref:Holin n=1 Tax=Pseudoxanthomonas winnipegensis TaxID=2480810 RepID=A0A4Q8LAR1_9GAMM|nr:holin [Pseudoxanthomonas winnipegensis]PZP58288.1 MAG: holin [Pseudoxanthomonas spadix]TAA25409.1 holin [Pseudoxanthomonas winnipegensis]
MIFSPWSLLAVPALAVIFVTAVAGLNDVQIRDLRTLPRRGAIIELVLGICFLVTALASLNIAVVCLLGGNVLSWRGCVLMWSIAGIFGTFGTFAPWRRWLQREIREKP